MSVELFIDQFKINQSELEAAVLKILTQKKPISQKIETLTV